MTYKKTQKIEYDPGLSAELYIKSEVQHAITETQTKKLEKKLAAPAADEPLDIEQAAKYFGISVSTIRRWVKTGKIPFISNRP